MDEGPPDAGRRPSRRRLVGLGLAGAGAALLASLGAGRQDGRVAARGGRDGPGRLGARPQPVGQALEAAPAAGMDELGLDARRDALVYVPAGYRADRPAPLAVVLHGAGSSALRGLDLLRDLADEAGLVLVAPQSRGATWDVILGGYGPDVDFIDRALEEAFSRYALDPGRLAVGGFSDGASYALSVGITNGDLFGHVLAFSPGFAAPAEAVGRPRVFVSHGVRDAVLPIDRCSRRIVPSLRRAGYDVTYREFDGPHAVPPEVAREGVAWLLGEEGS